MKVSIWDLDYYEKRKGFNTDCMKISSFHKQRGDSINFILSEHDINRPYDIIYIAKEDDKIQTPPARFFDKRAKVWGKGFRYQSKWKIPDIMLACRPDYLLYPNPSNAFERADMAQFFNDAGELLPLTQDYHNTFKNKKTLIIDRAFWLASEKNILFALDSLTYAWNVSFLEPISLKKVVCNELIRQKFLALEFTKNTKFKFINDIGDSFEDAELILYFLEELKEMAPKTDVGWVNFSPLTSNHYQSPTNAWEDAERCLKIIELGKSHGYQLRIQPLNKRLDTPYYVLFENISKWTQKAYKLSFLEYLAMPTVKRAQCTIEDVYSNSLLWTDKNFYNIMRTIKRRPEWVKSYCLRRWKENYLEITKIDWTNIKDNVY